MLKPQKRILPVGFWTGGKTATKKAMDSIRNLIVHAPGYNHQDENGFFEIDKATVVEIIQLIETTYIYDDKFYNKDRKNDIKELLCALEYCTDKSNGKIWGLHRENRNMNRLRDNGAYIDAPDDGRTDLRPARLKAKDVPVVMFIQQNGAICKDANGENIGWNGAPFYWPVLLTQENINPVMFALDQKNKGQKAVIDISDFLEGIDPKDILSLTYSGDLESHFGNEGSVYTIDECPWESRVLKQTTAGRFIQKNEDGNWLLNPNVKIDHDNYHGIYSLNNGKFPFVTRPYKYICLRNGRDAYTDIILLELFEQTRWLINPLDNVNDEGVLIDRDTKEVLLYAKDTIIDENLQEEEFIDNTIVQWEISYPIKKVLKLRKCTIDWDALFGKNE